MERRSSPRARCRLRCELTHLHQRASGTVLDISEGGLSVHTQLEIEEGEPLLVRIQVPGKGSPELETIVWHIRRGRRRDSGEPCNLLGLMVSNAPAAYLRLLPRTAPDELQGLERTPEPEQLPDLGTDSPGLCPFRIRVKARSGPHTRVLSLSAESESEARALAMSELNDEWHILEVQSA